MSTDIFRRYIDIVSESAPQSVTEMDKSQPSHGRDGHVSHSTYGSRDKEGSDYFKGKESPVKPISVKQMEKDALDILKKQGVAEGFGTEPTQQGTWHGHKIIANRKTPKGSFLIIQNKNDGKYEIHKHNPGVVGGLEFVSVHKTPEEMQAAFRQLTGVDESQQGVAEGTYWAGSEGPDGIAIDDPNDVMPDKKPVAKKLGPKAKAKTQMLKMYGDGEITFRKTSNGGYFIQHEDDFGDTHSHQYDPKTGKVDFSGVTRSTYYGKGVAEGIFDFKKQPMPEHGDELKIGDRYVIFDDGGSHYGVSWIKQDRSEAYEEFDKSEYTDLNQLKKAIWDEIKYQDQRGVAGGSGVVCPSCHSADIKTYSDGEKECNHCHKTWDVQGVAEGTKSLADYIAESERAYSKPVTGDYFAINIREETLFETWVCDETQDGIVIYADNTGLALLEQYGYLGDAVMEMHHIDDYEADSDGSDVDVVDQGEYDFEGDQAKDQLRTIVRAARRLNGMLDDDDNLPEWVQMKITKAEDYIDTAADYIESNREQDMDEAKYQGREVPLGKPMAGDVKKSKVYVRGPKGNVVKVNFGQKGMKIKKNIPGRRKNFRARHNCDNPGPRWKARYWSCRAW